MNNTKVIVSPAIVLVEPATDVLKRRKVVALAGGSLTMRRPGRLPKGAVLVQDALWEEDGKAGQPTPLRVGVAMFKQVAASRRRRMKRLATEP